MVFQKSSLETKSKLCIISKKGLILLLLFVAVDGKVEIENWKRFDGNGERKKKQTSIFVGGLHSTEVVFAGVR